MAKQKPTKEALCGLKSWITERIDCVANEDGTGCPNKPYQWNVELETWAKKLHPTPDPCDDQDPIFHNHHDIPPIPLAIGFLVQVVVDYANVSAADQPRRAKNQAEAIKLLLQL